MTVRADFTSQAFFRDPAAGVEKLRACGPVVATGKFDLTAMANLK